MDANYVMRAAELLTLLDDLAELEEFLDDKALRLKLDATNGDRDGGRVYGCALVENYEQMQRVLLYLRRDAQDELVNKLGVEL